MTDFLKAKRSLTNAIYRWAQGPSSLDSIQRFVKIEDAILALDNAAYDRGHAEARRSATDWTDFYIADSDRSGRRIEKMLRQQADMSVTIGQQGVEIEHLKTERDGVRAALTGERRAVEWALKGRDQARQNAQDWHQIAIDRAQDIERFKQRVADAHAERDGLRGELELLHERTSKEIERVREESVKLIGALGRIEVMSRNSLNDENLLSALKRVQAEAWEAYRNAQEVVLPIGEPFNGPEGDRNRLWTTLGQEPPEAERDQLYTALEVAERQRGRWRENAIALTTERNAARSELADARETIKYRAESQRTLRGELRLLRGTVADLKQGRLRKALETLADRYHYELCRGGVAPHSRKECTSPPQPVKDANAALAGESETTLRIHTYGEEGTGRVTFSRGRPDGGHTQPDPSPIAVIRDDRDPDIEAVLIGSRELKCAGGCGRTVKQGNVMYRAVRHVLVHPPLYTTKECVRRAMRLDAERTLRRPPPEPVRCRCALPEEKMPAIYKCDHRYPSGRPCDWTGSARDLSPTGRCPRCFREVRIVEKLP